MKKSKELLIEEFVADSLSAEDFDYLELPISRRIFIGLALVVVLVAMVVVGRIGYLNVVRGAFYRERGSGNSNLEVATPAYRGLITDRFGKVLAENTETFSVFINLNDLLRNRQRFNEVVAKVSEATGVAVEDLLKVINESDIEAAGSIPLIRGIFSETAIAIRGLALPEVRVEDDFRRQYIKSDAFGSIIGYTGVSDKGNLVVGRTGLEAQYDEDLRGQDGVYVYRRDAKGVVIDQKLEREPRAGAKLVTTLDADFQEYFYNRLSSGVRSLGTNAGAVGIAMNPETGEVLTLINYPGYDNNIFVTPGTNKERSEVINNSKKPLFNRAISGSYNPGSTIKPLVALAALREKIVTSEFQIFSKGYIEIPNPYVPEQPSRFVDWKPHGWVDVHSALARSSNVYFYEVTGGFEGLKGLGIEKLKTYWQRFGLGVKTGVDLSPESEGFLPDPAEKLQRTKQPWRIGDTYNVAIGQGDLLVSPLQLINFISSVGNGGHLLKPKFVAEIHPTDGSVGRINPAEVIYDYSDWQGELKDVQQGMRDAVREDYGTAKLLNTLPFSVAAKTGTAQIQNNTKTNALFVGYAPFENPKIAILVLVENAKEGSLNAVPVAYDVLNWYYQNRLLKN